MTTTSPKVLVAMPCRDTMPVATAKSIAATVKAGYDVVFATGGALPNARNEILRGAKQTGYAAVMMVDSDMVWVPEHVMELMWQAEHMNRSAPSIVSGRYYSRSAPHQPHAYLRGQPFPGPEQPGRGVTHEVEYTGAGFLYVPVEAVVRLVPEPWFDHSEKQGEDAYFCRNALKHGIGTFLYPWVTVGHVGITMFSDPQYEKVLLERVRA